MEPVLSPDEMRAADERTIASGTPGFELMDRAARACAVVALRWMGGAYGRRVVVLCGKGNNGGDGIAAARHLATAGASVTAFLLGEPTGAAASHLEVARRAGPRVRPWSRAGADRALGRADLAIDAIFGTGFVGEPRDLAREAIEVLGASGRPVLCVDIASGVSGADGSVPGAAVTADVTVAIQALKAGHVAPPGCFRCGRIDVADVGIAVDGAATSVPGSHDVAAVLPVRKADTHKYEVGAVGVLGGSAGMTGAAILAARAAYRSGAGLVVLGVPAPSLAAVEETVIEAVKVPLPEVEGQLDPKGLEEFAERIEKVKALAVGPGLGRGLRAVALIRDVLGFDVPLVLDADALWALGEILRDTPDVLRARRNATVLTPHAGEFAFLAGRPPASDRIGDVRDVARAWGSVVHLKGRRALTASPGGHVWVNTSGNPGMATGGSGDVLTGIVAALCAQGLDADDATWAGAHLHGSAGDVAAARIGSRSLQADDLCVALPQAIRRVSWGRPPHGRIRTAIEHPEGR